MTVFQSLLLGVLQGVAEFLPISSSGHLALLRQLMDLARIPLLYDVLLHVSTLIVVVIVFRKRIAAIFSSLWKGAIAAGKRGGQTQIRPEERENLRLSLYIAAATVVTGAVGLLLSRFEAGLVAHIRHIDVFGLKAAGRVTGNDLERLIAGDHQRLYNLDCRHFVCSLF